MQEFYFRKKNKETYFFTRNNKNKNNKKYDEWVEMCNKKEPKNTLNQLLYNLNLKLKYDFTESFLRVRVWENENNSKYKFICTNLIKSGITIYQVLYKNKEVYYKEFKDN